MTYYNLNNNYLLLLQYTSIHHWQTAPLQLMCDEMTKTKLQILILFIFVIQIFPSLKWIIDQSFIRDKSFG